MTFAGDMPTGHLCQLMRANFERVIDAAENAAEDVKEFVSGEASGADEVTIAISCIGRRLVLGPRAEEEVEALVEVLGEQAHIVGFYSYGELAPYQKGGACELHNQSMTLIGIKEKKAA